MWLKKKTKDNSKYLHLLTYILPILKQIVSISKSQTTRQREKIEEDFVRIILLINAEYEINPTDGWLLILICAAVTDCDKFEERINVFLKGDKEDFSITMKNHLIEKKENLGISFENFQLESLEDLSLQDADNMRKIFFQLSEIIINKDERDEEDNKRILDFIYEYLFSTEQKETINQEEVTEEQSKVFSKVELDTILQELNNLVGLDNIKNDIQSLINSMKINKHRIEAGLPAQKPPLHSIFLGSPGTGKTTIARILASIYNSLEILSENNLVETDRSGLVGGYIGQTAIKTDELINKALNGVLFIDEAYTLKKNNSNDDYGQEAIDILLKRMEDNRNNLIIIVAGYEEEMIPFLNSNPGLKSRFNRTFIFKDYNPSELTEIFNRRASKNKYIIKDEALKRIKELFEILYSKKDSKFGNARLVRNIYDKTVEMQSNRISSSA